DFVRRIGELRGQRKQIALKLDDVGVEVRVDASRTHQAEPGVQLVDLAVRIHARVAFLDARAVEQRGLAGIARPRVEFHPAELYELAANRPGSRVKPNPLPLPAPPERRRFRSRLLAWYRRHGRDLPWRKTDDPYHILVSEIMLQQTQVDRVLPKYVEWL